MEQHTKNPWDCPNTFGKVDRVNRPGQAHLNQWPLKISMLPVTTPYFHMTHLLLAADCSAFSYCHFHQTFLHKRILVTACPHTEGDLVEKLSKILRYNDILSIAVVRMDAPCCQSLTNAVIEAVCLCGKNIPIQFSTVFAEGEIVND